jgi:hypothetical protein
MRISSSLLARQPTELLRFRNAELWTQTITTHKSASGYHSPALPPISSGVLSCSNMDYCYNPFSGFDSGNRDSVTVFLGGPMRHSKAEKAKTARFVDSRFQLD